MEFLTIKNTDLYLSSGLDQAAFARTKITSLHKNEGIKADIADGKITFSNFSFDDTTVSEDGTVLFRFSGIKGTPLSTILSGDLTEEKILSVTTVLEVLSALISEEKNISAVGSQGILFDGTKEKSQVIILPPILFEQCARCIKSNEKPSYSDIQGKWLNKNLSGTDSLIFTRSVIAYTLLSGAMPFTEQDTSKRQEDIFDENFLPLEKTVEGLDEEICVAINAGLCVHPKENLTLGRRKINDKDKDLEYSRLRKKIALFDAKKIRDEALKNLGQKRKSSLGFIVSQSQFLKNQRKKLKIRRFFRRNGKTVAVISLLGVFAAWATVSFQRENARLASTIGLDSGQTTALLYQFIDSADVPNLQEVIHGKNTKDLTVKVTGFYVRSKERQGYNQDAGTVSPAEWLFFKEKSDYWMYGITNFRIDGKETSFSQDFPRRKDKNKPLSEENGTKLKKGDTKTHDVSYFLIHNDAATIYIEKITEKATLTWNGKKWRVTELSGKTKSLSAKKKSFAEDYHSLLSENGGDIRKTTEMLRADYEWLPTESEIETGAKKLAKKYGSTSAQEFLKKN